jgi:hypothetical protein
LDINQTQGLTILPKFLPKLIVLSYKKHNYAIDHIWNFDEIGIQIGIQLGAKVLAK